MRGTNKYSFLISVGTFQARFRCYYYREDLFSTSSLENSVLWVGIHILLKKRLFSSPAAFAKTLAKHREALEAGRKQERKAAFDERILHRAIMKAEEEFANESAADEATNEVLELNGTLTAALTAEQRNLLDKNAYEGK